MGLFDQHTPRKREVSPPPKEQELVFHDKEKPEEIHLEILEECRDIETPKEMQDYVLPVGAERFYPEPERVFHDTVPLDEQDLSQARETAKKQKAMVLDFFKTRWGYNYTPAEVHNLLIQFGNKILLNSVRRSITNLTTEEKLIKCPWDERRMGRYGKDNRTWKYNSEYVASINPKP